jgi:Spy/CpxP family protein refolding chaperone
MNSIRNLLAGTALAAAALSTAGTVFSLASAADETTTAPTTPPAGGPHGWHHRHHGMGFLYSKLGLTDAQKAAIKSIMQTNGPQLQTLHQQMHANSLKLRQTQPNDPNYSNVVAQVSAANANLHQQMDTLKATVRQEIFGKLTSVQQTQLQKLEAQMQARHGAGGPRGAGAPPPAT